MSERVDVVNKSQNLESKFSNVSKLGLNIYLEAEHVLGEKWERMLWQRGALPSGLRGISHM